MTVSTMYDTSMDVKIFTFDLAGKCERPSETERTGSHNGAEHRSRETKVPLK